MLSSTLGLGLLGSLLLFAAQPPLGWWPLAWLAPLPWALIVRRPKLAGRRPYRSVWLAGCVYWLLAVHWLRLPHLLTSIGWLALSCYLGCYLSAFVYLSRRGVHVHGWPTPLSMAIVWSGLELVQAHLLSGFNMASPANSQIAFKTLIQIADLVGGYGVSFVIVFVGACLAQAWHGRLDVRPLGAAGMLLAAVLGYGAWRDDQYEPQRGPTVTLIQGSIDTMMHEDARQAYEHAQRAFDQYVSLTLDALSVRRDTDLIVWPETMYRNPLITHAEQVTPPAGEPWTFNDLRQRAQEYQSILKAFAKQIGRPTLLGIDAWHYEASRVHRTNSAVLLESDGTVSARYNKMHPVMFGEYIPLAKQIPWLYQITPLAGGIDSGDHATALRITGSGGQPYSLCPSICYESVLSHVIRRSVNELTAEGTETDVLVNLTNDGWFWGSSELDMHLACGVMRAVECRKPLLIAANTGFSAWIDSQGTIVRQGQRRATDTIVADVQLDSRQSLYLAWGDWFAGACLLVCIASCLPRRSKSQGYPPGDG